MGELLCLNNVIYVFSSVSTGVVIEMFDPTYWILLVCKKCRSVSIETDLFELSLYSRFLLINFYADGYKPLSFVFG